MAHQIDSERISGENQSDAFRVADRCFSDEWPQARIREDFGRIVNDQTTFFEPALKEEVNLLEYYLHRVRGDVVGLSGLYNYSSKPQECWLGWFCVDPDQRREGYGAAILHHIVERAKALRMSCIFLHTEKSNSIARGFYEKQGFVLLSEAEYWDRDLVRYKKDLR